MRKLFVVAIAGSLCIAQAAPAQTVPQDSVPKPVGFVPPKIKADPNPFKPDRIPDAERRAMFKGAAYGALAGGVIAAALMLQCRDCSKPLILFGAVGGGTIAGGAIGVLAYGWRASHVRRPKILP